MRRQLPPLTRVRLFEAAAHHSSFSRAANELNLTPAAVSQGVRALEEHLGILLFTRGARQVELTEAGRSYLARISTALDEIASATDEVSGSDANGSNIVVGAFGGVLHRWLLPLWADAQTEMPQVSVRLISILGEVDFDSREIDATVRTNGRPSPNLCCERLIEASLYPVASKSYLRRVGTPKSLASLLKLQLLHSDSRPDDWRNWLSAAGVAGPIPEATPGCHFESMGTLTDAVAAGMGIALAIDCLIERELANKELIRLLPDIPAQSCHFDLIYPGNRMSRPAFREFRDLLIDRCT